MASGSDASAGKSYSTDPALYIYTSLTAGSSHIVTATSRLETILRANRVPFKAIDLATDEKARMLWGRRAGKDESGRVRKLPGLVQMGMVLGDIVEIEDWNEYGELKQHVTIYYDDFTQPSISQKPKDPPKPKPATATVQAAAQAAAQAANAPPKPAPAAPVPPPAPAPKEPAAGGGVKEKVADAAAKVTLPIRSVAEEAAQKAKQLHLQSLRDKVAKAKGDGAASAEEKKGDEKENDATAAATGSKSLPSVATSAASSQHAGAGLQSPTTGAWKGESPSLNDVAALRTVQSPTTTSWKPTDVEPPTTSFMGSKVASASAEEIKALEKEQAIQEEDEEEEDDDDEEDEEDEDEDDDDDEEPAAAAAAAKESSKA